MSKGSESIWEDRSKSENGRWRQKFIEEVIRYGRDHGSHAAAIRKYKVPASTYFGWLRRPEFRKKGKERNDLDL